METIGWVLAQLLWAAGALVIWLLTQLLWLILWSLVPIALAAVVAVLVAERVLEKAVVRGFVARHANNMAGAAWLRCRRTVPGLLALPVRVSGWFVLYLLWHSVLRLWFTPRWTPWQRAWQCRWGRALRVPARV
jgi:hypothetical protein